MRTLCLQLAVLLLLATSACADDGPYQKLVGAINQANGNARGCKQKTGFGEPVILDLKTDITLLGPLPTMLRGAVLIINGKCGEKGNQRCIIDGAGKFPIFRAEKVIPLAMQGLQSHVRVTNLVFQNVVGGVFVSMWAQLTAIDCVFRGNKGGVEIGETNSASGNPTRTFFRCQFVNNTGTVLHADNGLFGLASGKAAYVVRNSLFIGNTGNPKGNGGAVMLTGAGSSIFENVIFRGNTAYGAGGAVYASATTVIFRRTSFVLNKALAGRGGAVFGGTSEDGDFSANFCSCTFSGNVAVRDPKSNNLNLYVESPGDDVMSVTFCGVATSPGMRIPQNEVANIMDHKTQLACTRTC